MIGELIADAEGRWSVIERAIAGDELAFARIVAEHHDDLARIAFFVSGDLDVAEEAEQAAWAVAYRRLKDVRDPSRLRPWLMSIAANEARQLVRSGRRRTVREIGAASSTSGSGVDRAELIDLAAAVGRLDPRDRQLLGLRFIGGFEPAEIARAMEMSASNVRVRLHRLLARLRTELRDD